MARDATGGRLLRLPHSCSCAATWRAMLYRWVFLLAVLTATACGEEASPPVAATSNDTVTTTDVADTLDSGPVQSERMIEGRIYEAESGLGIGAAEVCSGSADAPSCATTDASGEFQLSAPSGAQELRWSAASYRSGRAWLSAEFSGAAELPTISESLWMTLLETSEADGAMGVLTRFVTQDEAGEMSPLKGVEVSMIGQTAASPVYGLESGGEASAEASTLDGYALFIGTSEGSHALVATHPDGACAPSLGIASGSLNVQVVPDHVSFVLFECVVVESNETSIQGSVRDFELPDTISGVQICLEGGSSSKCTFSNADGNFELEGAEAGVEQVVTTQATGYWDTRTPVIPGKEGASVEIRLRKEAETLISLPPIEDDSQMGSAFLIAYKGGPDSGGEDPLSGVSFLLTPAAGLGPFYATGDGAHSGTAPATFTAGEAAYLRLPTGTYQARLTHPWGDCSPGYGVEADEQGQFPVFIAPGVDTRITAICDVSPPETSSVIGHVTNVFTGEPIAEAAICLQSISSTGATSDELCAFTDAGGDYTLSGVPSNSVRYIEISKEGFFTVQVVLGISYGTTYYSRMSPEEFAQAYFYGPTVAAGICPPVDDWDTYDRALWGGRIYDTAYNTDTFFQGKWLDRGRAYIQREDTGENVEPVIYHGKNSLPDLSSDGDELSASGLFWTCDMEPGTYRVWFEHPWGDCTVGAGLPPEEDGSYVAYMQPSVQTNVNGMCTLTPPGTIAEELSSYPPLASMHLLMETAGMLEGLSMAELPPGGLVASERMTLFAPSSVALSAFLLENGQLGDAEQATLIGHHMLQGERELHELIPGEVYWTTAGTPLEFAEDEQGDMYIVGSGAKIVEAEHWALDGIIYIIDEVLVPPAPPESAVEELTVSADSGALIGGEQPQVASWETGATYLPKYTVYTPPGYYNDAPVGYPVLYVLHDVGGDNESLFGGETLGQVPTNTLPQVLETLIQSGSVPPLIVVGINGMSLGYGSYFLDSETESGAPGFGSYQAYVKAVMDEVEATYNTATSPDSPAGRAVLGHGMGGFGAAHLAAAHPMFSAVVLHSSLLSLSDLLKPDGVVASSYAGEDVDGSLWSQVKHAWDETYGESPLDGRLLDLLGPEHPAIARAIGLASAMSPRRGLFGTFDMGGSTGVGANLVTDVDMNPANNNQYPVFAAEESEAPASFDEEYVGFELPWLADGTLVPEVWDRWEAHEPLAALTASAEQLIAADTDFFIDCGTLDERGLSDQSQLFFLELLSVLGNQSATFEAHPGDHASQLYTERLYASLIWLGQVLEEEATELP
ncbi:MAG: hypothetical protein CL940_07325 [Deltaproteobacteria bacterium]|nr:hypothetical protein [Deltaproteobacteria bacterium]